MPTVRAAPMPPQERRAAIVRATLPLLVEHGRAVTTRQIAAAAGVSEGTIFNVFDDKDDLLRATVEAALDPAPYERSIAAIDPRLPFEQQVAAAADISRRHIAQVWKLISAIGPEHHPPRRRPMPESPALVDLFERFRSRLRVEPAEAARLLGALTLSLTHPMLTDQARSSGEIVDLFLHGAAARRARSTERS